MLYLYGITNSHDCYNLQSVDISASKGTKCLTEEMFWTLKKQCLQGHSDGGVRPSSGRNGILYVFLIAHCLLINLLLMG